MMFAIFNPSCHDPGREKINLNFYFHTSFWCLKRFYEGLKGLQVMKALVYTLMQFSEMHGAGSVRLMSVCGTKKNGFR